MAMPSHAVRRRVVVRGRVQGVWFRDSCRSEAQLRAVSGWVRNRSDGAVEAVFEGPPGAVAAMIDWCHAGPPRARIVDVDVTEEAVVGEVGFDVR